MAIAKKAWGCYTLIAVVAFSAVVSVGGHTPLEWCIKGLVALSRLAH